MSIFSGLNETKQIKKTIQIDVDLYNHLAYLSSTVYNTSINNLVNMSINDLIKKENIRLYKIKNKNDYISRSFVIRKKDIENLENLKNKYGIAIYRLVNIGIRNALIEEGLIIASG